VDAVYQPTATALPLTCTTIQAAWSKGRAAGCVPAERRRGHACDWAPSSFSAHAGLETTARRASRARASCIDRLGGSVFDNRVAAGDVIDPACGVTDTSRLPALQSLRTQFVAYDYAASTPLLDRFFIDFDLYRHQVASSCRPT